MTIGEMLLEESRNALRDIGPRPAWWKPWKRRVWERRVRAITELQQGVRFAMNYKKGGGKDREAGASSRNLQQSDDLIAPPRSQRSEPVIAGGASTGEGALSFDASFAQVAAAVGVSERTVRRWVNGESRPSPLARAKLEEKGWL